MNNEDSQYTTVYSFLSSAEQCAYIISKKSISHKSLDKLSSNEKDQVTSPKRIELVQFQINLINIYEAFTKLGKVMSRVGVRVGTILNTWFYPKEAQNPVKEVRQTGM